MITREMLWEASSLPADQLATEVNEAAAMLTGRAIALRTIVQRGRLFTIPTGMDNDRLLVATSLMAVVVQGVDVHSPYLKRAQMSVIEEAVDRIGADLADVLGLVRYADDIVDVLMTSAPT